MKTLTRTLLLSFCASLFFLNQLKASEPLKTGFTIKLAYIMPQSGFGEFPSSFDYTLKSVDVGFGIQLGKMYFINAIDLGDKFKIGIDVTWLSFSYHTADYYYLRNYTDNNIQYTDAGEFSSRYLYLNAEVGPSFSYSPVEKMALDISFKISPTYVVFAGDEYNLSTGNSERIASTGSSFRYTPAFYFRYSLLLIGVEYSIGDVDMNYDSSGFELIEKKATVPLDVLRLVFGVKF